MPSPIDRTKTMLIWLRERLWDERQLPQFVVSLENGSDVFVLADYVRVRQRRLTFLAHNRHPVLSVVCLIPETVAIFDDGYWKACALIEGSKEGKL